jgi:hypothetical protein
MANGIAGSAEAGLPHTRGTGRRAIARAGHHSEFSLEGSGGEVLGHCGNQLIAYQKMDALFDSETTQTDRLKEVTFQKNL